MPIKIRMIVVDNHAMVAAGLSAELNQQNDFEVVQMLHSPEDLLKSIEDLNADAVLMDVRLGAFNGIQMTEKVKEKYPGVKVILISGYNMGQLAKSSKADAFASKEEPIASLSATIRKVCLENASVFPGDSPWEDKLTQTEIKVLQLLGEDLTRKEIAAALYISEKTVANHMTSILQKLNVRSRIGAVLKGVELGLINSNLM